MIRNVLIAAAAFVALPAPGKDEVAHARQTCLADQSRMAVLERNASWCTDDQKVLSARQTAERSCGEAMKLMVAAGLEPKPAEPRPAPPAPTLVIREQMPAAAAAEFAQMEVNCESGGTASR